MSKKLITFATIREAGASIERFGIDTIIPERLYSCHDGIILITGIGSVAAATATAQHLAEVEAVWNLGIVGGLTPYLPIGDVVIVGKVRKHTEVPPAAGERSQIFANSIAPEVTIATQGVTLVTADYPVMVPNLRDRLSQQGDIVDMEGYGIAHACQEARVPCIIKKVVSDLCLPDGPEVIKSKLSHWSEVLADILESSLSGAEVPICSDTFGTQ